MIPRSRLQDLGRAAFLGVWVLAGGWLLQGALFGDHGLLAVRRHRAELAGIERKNESLRAEILSLESEIRALQEDPLEIERLAREHLLLSRPDQTLYVFSSSGSPGRLAGVGRSHD